MVTLPQTASPSDPVGEIHDTLLTDDMASFRVHLEAALAPQAGYLTEAELAIYRRGKKIRPTLMLLSARMLTGATAEPAERVVKGAVSLEMLHVATLIHDDIVDHALTRRGLASVNAARGTETAIIVGDMQFVQAIRGFVDTIAVQSDMELVRLVLDTAFRICCGELDELQTDPAWDTALLHSRYLATVDRKTAVLFGLACEAGITLAGGKMADARRGGLFGRQLGSAFQMMDDLFDFLHGPEIAGKPLGMDLAQRRVSLPLIYAMEELGPQHLVTRIMRGADFTPDQLAAGIQAVRHSAGFQRAYAEARAKALEAITYLDRFPDNRYRQALRACLIMSWIADFDGPANKAGKYQQWEPQMSSNSISFIYNTLLNLLNNPNNSKYYLPPLLQSMTSSGTPVLPLQAANWSLGVLTGEAGDTAASSLAGSWYIIASNQQYPKSKANSQHCGIPAPCQSNQPGACAPTSPPTPPTASCCCPAISLSNVTVDNLQYVLLQSNPVITPTVTGYQVTFALQQPCPIPNQSGNEPNIRISGDFQLLQSVCTAPAQEKNPTQCDGYLAQSTVNAYGAISVSLPQAALTLDIALAPAADGASVVLSVNQITLTVPDNATLTVTSLVPGGDLPPPLPKTFAEEGKTALENPATLTAMVQNLNAALNQASYLGPIQTQMNTLVNNSLNSVFGLVPGTGLVTDNLASGTNPIDGYILARIHTALATPGNSYYLPQILRFFQNPTIEPYTIASISLPNQTLNSEVFSQITLTNLAIAGISNATLPAGSMSMTDGVIQAIVNMSTLSPGPTLTGTIGGNSETLTVPNPPLTITGDFSFVPGAAPSAVTGTATITITSGLVTGQFAMSGSDSANLAISITSLTVSLPIANPATSYVNFSIDLSQGMSGLDSIVDSLLNNDSVIADLLNALNQAAAPQLPSISQTASSGVQTLITNQLNG